MSIDYEKFKFQASHVTNGALEVRYSSEVDTSPEETRLVLTTEPSYIDAAVNYKLNSLRTLSSQAIRRAVCRL